MSKIVQEYVDLIKNRSDENKKSMNTLFEQGLIGNCISILRQELDTFIRIIYLGRESNLLERERLMQLTLDGKKWKILTVNNKFKNVTDSDMVNISKEIKGYVEYVYKFGSSFIHLSNYHNYKKSNPFDTLPMNEQLDIIIYLNQYHGFPKSMHLTVPNVAEYLPKVFKKISDNMLYYNEQLIEGTLIDF